MRIEFQVYFQFLFCEVGSTCRATIPIKLVRILNIRNFLFLLDRNELFEAFHTKTVAAVLERARLFINATANETGVSLELIF